MDNFKILQKSEGLRIVIQGLNLTPFN